VPVATAGKPTILNMIVRMVVASNGSQLAAVPPHEVVPLTRGPVRPDRTRTREAYSRR